MKRLTNKVIIFRWLGQSNLIAALFFRLIGWQVLFIEPLGRLRTKNWITRFSKWGITTPDYHSYNGYAMCEDLVLANKYAENIIDRLYSEVDFIGFANMIPDGLITSQKGRSVLFNSLFKEIESYGKTYSLAEYFRSRGTRADVFQSRTIAASLIASQKITKVRNFYPGWGVSLLFSVLNKSGHKRVAQISKFIFYLLFKSRTLKDSSRIASVDIENKDIKQKREQKNKPVIYFPHKGPFYGKLFVKDQYYSKDVTSPFYKENIEHVELGITGSEAKSVASDYEKFGIPVTFISLQSHLNWKIALSAVIKFWRFHEKGARIARLYMIVRCLLLVHKFRDSFHRFEGVRIALLGYDSLYPIAAVVALQSMGIKVIANQERFIEAFYSHYTPILNLYFVHGEVVKKQFEKNKNTIIDDIVVIGDIRCNKIQENKIRAKEERCKRFGDKAHICLVLDYVTNPDAFTGAFNFCLDFKSNQFYYNSIIELAIKNIDCAFIIRGKNANWLELKEMSAIKDKIKALDNVHIDMEYSRFDRSYELAAMADIVIARHTSLSDQCLAEGIPVLNFDAMPNGEQLVSTTWHDYAPYPVFVSDNSSLTDRFKQTIRDGFFMEPDQFKKMRKDYYNAGDDVAGISPQDRLIQGLEKMFLN